MIRFLDSASTRIIPVLFLSAWCRNADFHEGKCLGTYRRPPTRTSHARMNGEDYKRISTGRVYANEDHVLLYDEKIFTIFFFLSLPT